MTSRSATINRRINHKGFVVLPIVLASALIFSAHPAKAQKTETYRLPPNLKQYFTDKYQNIRDITSTLQETMNGPQGYLHLSGHFLPKNAPAATEGDRNSRAEATAKAFLAEESALLGITNMDELRKFGTHTSKGFGGEYTNVYYRRYINGLQLENHDIHITIGPDDKISFVSADLVQAPPELYQAAAKETLKENMIREAIARDLKTAGFRVIKLEIKYIRKFVVPLPPYVIWSAYAFAGLEGGSGSWEYKIDAFTGEVVQRLPGGSN